MLAHRFPALLLLAPALIPASPALAAAPPPADAGDIVVNGRAIAQVGLATSGSQGVVGYADFEDRPIARVGELAENVPGLIATQHSGSGKANQYFLRGFNLDHGTDLAGFLDGAPLNMRSHAHGQGYLDLNPLIPELVERIDYAKGPYHADAGDFSAAGTMRLTTRNRLAHPLAEATIGSFGHIRALLAGSTDLAGGTLLGALEATHSDGPWLLPERQRKWNAVLKYSTADWSLGLSAYSNSWVATDQVPERAIAAGLIPRNGFIDPNLGGRAGRIALTFAGHLGETAIAAYAIGSRLELTSNFTYFLDNPVAGDEFRQVDRRGLFGGALRREWHSGAVTWRVGADARWDAIGRLGLYHTTAGQVVSTLREDTVDEVGGALYAEGEATLAPGLRLVGGLRGDAIAYRVHAGLAVNSGSGSAALLAPKAALAWQAAPGLEFYADYGESYHSNDVRGATIRVDPASGAPADRVPVMARARGAELGGRLERGTLSATLTLFRLDLASELVFAGDTGTTEANPASRREGAELALFWKAGSALTLDGAAAWTRARYQGTAGFIPNATPFVLGAGASLRLGPHWSASARIRHFAGAPLTEDGLHRAQPTTLVNLGAYWTRGGWRLGADLLNLFDAADPDISYWYASRLPGEPATGVADRHIHPVEPRQLRITLRRTL